MKQVFVPLLSAFPGSSRASKRKNSISNRAACRQLTDRHSIEGQRSSEQPLDYLQYQVKVFPTHGNELDAHATAFSHIANDGFYLDLPFWQGEMQVEARPKCQGFMRSNKGAGRAEIFDARGDVVLPHFPGNPQAIRSGDSLVSSSFQIGAWSHRFAAKTAWAVPPSGNCGAAFNQA